MKLPPTLYARQGGEVIAAMPAKVGIVAKLENAEWVQWLSGVYGQKAHDLTMISPVEPLDFGSFARPGYYWGYESPEFSALWAKINATIACRAQPPAGRSAAAGGQRRGGRLPVPADLDHGGQRPREGTVEGHADLRQ